MIAGIACGLACAAFVALFLGRVEGEAERERAEMLARYGGEQLEACVAVRDIAAGETVSSSDIELRVWLADMLPDDAALSLDDVVGRRVSSLVLKNEVLSERRFAVSADRLEVPYGYSAVSLPAREVQAVGGSIREGMSIDVYATGSSSTQAIARSALVLSVSEQAKESLVSTSSQWITVAVQPERVQELVTAAQTMDLYFVLPGEGVEVFEETGGDEVEPGDEGEGVGESEGAGAHMGETPDVGVRAGESDGVGEAEFETRAGAETFQQSEEHGDNGSVEEGEGV